MQIEQDLGTKAITRTSDQRVSVEAHKYFLRAQYQIQWNNSGNIRLY